ncbi:polyphosphate kinase 2 family protein [Nibrella saemangeumensis]|uniref:Polyphosphate kinase 2 family protein n=1 Tax=Nibrella saemangeumensis TaxID=1084526 RepID=A0ABP8MFW6_9BACT
MSSPTDLSTLNIDDFRYDGRSGRKLSLKKAVTKLDDLYKDSDDYDKLLRELTAQIDELQQMMYAHNRYGLVVIFQAMDAAGKDGTIQHVFSGVNPLGMRVHSYKRPSDKELDHDFMWRNLIDLPERGTIGVFNRSYYEEVLVVRVHPEILTEKQHLPQELTADLDKVWKHRFDDIRNLEAYLFRNGFRVIKFFLNISFQEQGERLLKRIANPAKNWKFDEQDVVERGFWKQYMAAYEEAINETADDNAPWYVIPADDKKNMRLIVARVLANELKKLKLSFPEVNKRQHKTLQQLKEVIEGQNKNKQ